MTGEPTYESWKHAKALGDVEMCQEWRESFEAFLADMGERPEGTKLARIDPERGFAPGNCAWLDQRTLNARKAAPAIVTFVQQPWHNCPQAGNLGLRRISQCIIFPQRRRGNRVESHRLPLGFAGAGFAGNWGHFLTGRGPEET